MRVRKPALVAAAAAAALSLAACEGEDGHDGASRPAPGAGSQAPSASAPADPGGESSPESPSGGDGATRGSTAAPPPATASATVAEGICRTSRLAFSSSGGMAEGEVLITLRNTGSTPCSMRGFPGLDLRGGEGTVSAARSDRTVRTVALAPGEASNFALHFPPNLSGGSGVTFTTAVVTPPDETRSHTMPLTVNVAAGATASRITVDPVGSGK
ncbi:DUF4232 domain-containing protein [Streptomyces nitrosporeus]|uniref:DUF4232 domain-containing protein n=1 Tax=Streptomyces nitrosporeus TaxID=28894 RepID=UPI00331D3655